MTYTPINWATGDTITADRLNKMDNGWSVESTQLFNETVTTVTGERGNSATLAYSTLIDAPTITVTFDGTDYTCSRIDTPFGYYYGGFTPMGLDPTDYPFFIESMEQANNIYNNIYTETTSTHTVAVSVSEISVGDTFRDAVAKCSDSFQLEVVGGVTTFLEAYDALAAGKRVFSVGGDDNEHQYVALYADFSSYAIKFAGILSSSSQSVSVMTMQAESEDSPLN